VAAAKWPNWSPLTRKVLNGGNEGTVKTDRLLVSSVLSVPGKPDAESSETPLPGAGTINGRGHTSVDCGWGDLTDPTTAEAFRGNASLLAIAYQRYTRIPKVPVDQAKESVTKELALSTVQERS
jgi:hypothetical protein